MNRIHNLPPIPSRPVDGHKGLFGRVLVIGGNDAMLRAVLAGTAALRAGSGLVQIAVPKSILQSALSITPELIGLGLGRSSKNDELLDAAKNANVVVLGPGLGQSPEAKERVTRLVRLDKPFVIDADALNILASQERWPKSFKAHAVLTPHPGEMKRLAKLIGRSEVPNDDEGRIDIAIAASQAFGQIVVLKGHRTVVTDGDRVYVNHTGDSSLSKAGAGDVLSGLIGSLIGQGMESFAAACAGVFIHGRAGESAGQKMGRRSVLAREVIDALPTALAQYESEHGTTVPESE